jgi:alkylation response protein AidB-like acyl-CoA dehydrogenase
MKNPYAMRSNGNSSENRSREFQSIQQYLADNETELECSDCCCGRAACRQDQGESIASYASMVKYYGSETALRVVSRALQIHGAYGYTKDFPIERHYEMRLCTISKGRARSFARS